MDESSLKANTSREDGASHRRHIFYAIAMAGVVLSIAIIVYDVILPTPKPTVWRNVIQYVGVALFIIGAFGNVWLSRGKRR